MKFIKGKIITSSQLFNLIQVKQKRRGNSPLTQSIKHEFYVNFSRKCIKYLKWWLEHNHMNSNHPTLYFRYEEETKWSITLGKYDHIKIEAQTVISMTQESLINLHAFTLLFKNRYVLQKIIPQHDGFQPPSHKIDANIYKNNRSSKKIHNWMIGLI